MGDDLTALPWLVQHSKRVLRIVQQNIAIALGLKLAVFVLALGGYATLWMAIAGDMEGKTICVFADAAAWPVQSYIAKFREEFEEFVRSGRSAADRRAAACSS